MNKVSIIESDRNKFEIQFDTMLEMVAIFKKYDCKYNAKEKRWSFNKIDYDAVFNELKQIACIENKKLDVEIFMKHDLQSKKIRIKMSIVDREILDIVKSINGRKYIISSKEWEIDEKYENELEEKLSGHKITKSQ